jgi:hypothetical protein
MSRSEYPQASSKNAAKQPSVSPGTMVVKNAQVASKSPSPERAAPIEPHWEPVIDSATD